MNANGDLERGDRTTQTELRFRHERDEQTSVRFGSWADEDSDGRSTVRIRDWAELQHVKSRQSDRSISYRTEESDQPLDIKNRLRHFTWTWFTLTMATGGIANVLAKVPFRFHGLYAIGATIFLLNIVFFIMNVSLISLRFYWWPATFKASLMHPTESLFVPAAVISIAVILDNITEYGLEFGKTGPWLVSTMVVMYWLYVALAVGFSCSIYLLMWSTQVFTIAQMTPVWTFPAYPLLIVGPFAGVLTNSQIGVSAHQGLQIIVGGFIVQTCGFFVTMMIYSAFIYRLMTQKLPAESSRPAMFISVGPAGFTISGLINMAYNIPRVMPTTFMHTDGVFAGQVTRLLGFWAGISMWGLALWFFFVSVGAHWSTVRRGRMDFAMTWYAFVFPNSALVTGTFAVAKALDHNHSINVLGCVLACIVITVWLFMLGMNVRAVAIRQILWPQKGEDKEEDAIKSELRRRQRNEEGIFIERAR